MSSSPFPIIKIFPTGSSHRFKYPGSCCCPSGVPDSYDPNLIRGGSRFSTPYGKETRFECPGDPSGHSTFVSYVSRTPSTTSRSTETTRTDRTRAQVHSRPIGPWTWPETSHRPDEVERSTESTRSCDQTRTRVPLPSPCSLSFAVARSDKVRRRT